MLKIFNSDISTRRCRLLGILTLLAILLYPAQPGAMAGDTIRIGVLAKRGPVIAYKRWNALAAYLTRAMGKPCKIIPLNFFQLEDYVANDQLDVIIANQKFFVSINKRYGAYAIATLVNRRGGPYMGGVIFTRADSAIRKPGQVRNKRVAVVSLGSAGGFLIQAYELLHNNGINVMKDTSLKPLQGQDFVVYAVLNGAADVGFVRTDQLESMALEKKIDLKNFNILTPRHFQGFNLLCSTGLWPAWPVAVSRNMDKASVAALKAALFKIKPGSKTALTARIKGFTKAEDYSAVEKAMQALHLKPFL